jgi:hypothetical protein
VPKHGSGNAHERLLNLTKKLPFKVQSTFGELHEEGDVCPPSDLVLVSVEHLEQCCDLIEASWNIIQSSVPCQFSDAGSTLA